MYYKETWGYSKVDWITYFRCFDARFRRYLCKIDGLKGGIGNVTFPKVATTDHRRYRPIPIGGILQRLPEAGAFRGRREAVVGSGHFGAIDDRYACN